MPEEIDPLLEETIEVAASPATVWSLVSDLGRMSAWSPQVVKTFVRGGPVQQGTRTFNINRRGLLVWPTQAKVVRFEPERELAFRVKDNFTVWSFTLEPTDAGTRIIQRREAPNGISDISIKLTALVFGGQRGFGGELRQGMRQTLSRIKAEAEAV
ncbi:SRPBCC family protein [Nocardioides sp.]|uniref:SRPBCC family protein n=1 Tax=Nocardioides sp. TaxID=35761 RepID=UPI00356B0741